MSRNSSLSDSLRKLGFSDAASDTQSLSRLDRKMSEGVKQVGALISTTSLQSHNSHRAMVGIVTQAISELTQPAGSLVSKAGFVYGVLFAVCSLRQLDVSLVAARSAKIGMRRRKVTSVVAAQNGVKVKQVDGYICPGGGVSRT
jgi:hypothetical protein